MKEGTHDVGYLKRVDQPNGFTKLVDGFGETVAELPTDQMPDWSKDGDVRRFRLEVTNP